MEKLSLRTTGCERALEGQRKFLGVRPHNLAPFQFSQFGPYVTILNHYITMLNDLITLLKHGVTIFYS